MKQFKNIIKEEVLREVDAKSIAQQLKGKHVTNPETKKKIKASTALSYGKDHPAYKVAIGLIKKTKSIAKTKSATNKSKPDNSKSTLTDLQKKALDKYIKLNKDWDVRNELSQIKSLVKNGFEDPEQAAKSIRGYFGNLGRPLNHKIKQGELNDVDKKRIAHLDEFVKKYDKYEENKPLYRGAPISNNLVKDFKEGKVISYKGYSSATTNLEVAESFSVYKKSKDHSSVVFEIKNTKGIPTKVPDYFVAGDDEKEYLYSRDSKFKIISVTPKGKTVHVTMEPI